MNIIQGDAREGKQFQRLALDGVISHARRKAFLGIVVILQATVS